jgi:hypothetical protein
MTLDFCEVPVVEIPRILKLVILEYDNTSSLIPDCQVLSGFVIRNRSKNIILRNIFLVALSQSIDVNPVETICYSIRINLRFSTLRLPQVL